ncbi:MAG: hypothetical protein CM1200mP18_18800 [Gammaproteobacteria bacterium]|nr:MAG: hypothetical protein CM1200mP18_18800 [Gammaproteobacteria bacterium]
MPRLCQRLNGWHHRRGNNDLCPDGRHSVFATGGIGGVHRGWQDSLDVLPISETFANASDGRLLRCKITAGSPCNHGNARNTGVPVVGLGTRELPAFFSIESGIPLHQWADDIAEAAQIIQARQQLALGGGELVVVPRPRS